MRILIIFLFMLPTVASGGIKISAKIQAPFTSVPEVRTNIDSHGNKTNVFLQMTPSDEKRMLLYMVGETNIAKTKAHLSLLEGWGNRVIAGKNSVNNGVLHKNSRVYEESAKQYELRYEMHITDAKMRQHVDDGFGFASGRRVSKETFIQIGTECYGFSKSRCESKYREFRDGVKFIP
jgi:hypothetical protein